MGSNSPKSRKEYKVGYGKPPTHSRFKKGQSGNPNGRPKGSTNRRPKNQLETIFKKELSREIPIQGGAGEATVSMLEAMIHSTAVKAVKGDIRSLKLVFDMYRAMQSLDAENEDDTLSVNIHFTDDVEMS